MGARKARHNPKRYIGDATITIRILDDDSYAGTISAGGRRWKFADLHAPRAGLGVALDSPEAFDEMAQAAVSFGSYYSSMNRGPDLPDWAPAAEVADAIEDATVWVMDDQGRYEVRRRRATKNPVAELIDVAALNKAPGFAIPNRKAGESWLAYHDRLSAQARADSEAGRTARASALQAVAGHIARLHRAVRERPRKQGRAGPGTYPWKQCIADAIRSGARSPQAVCGAIRARSRRKYPAYWEARR